MKLYFLTHRRSILTQNFQRYFHKFLYIQSTAIINNYHSNSTLLLHNLYLDTYAESSTLFKRLLETNYNNKYEFPSSLELILNVSNARFGKYFINHISSIHDQRNILKYTDKTYKQNSHINIINNHQILVPSEINQEQVVHHLDNIDSNIIHEKINLKEPIFDSNKKQKLFESIEMEIRGHDEEVLKSYLKFIQMVIEHLDLQTSQICVIPYHLIRRTTLKSPHIHKRARVQYERRTYRRSLTFYRLTENNANVLLTYLQYNLPEGVGMELSYKYVEPIPDFLL